MSHAPAGSAPMMGDQVQPVARRNGGAPGGPPGRRARIIVLLGIDGAGKTTVAAALVTAEQEAGRSAILLRNRSGRRWLSRTAARFGLDVSIRWVDRAETVVRTVNVLVSQFRARRREGLAIMDRHLVCQLVLRRVRGLPPGPVLPWLVTWLLRGVIVIVLDVPAETAQVRILTRGEDDEPLEYLRAARSAYLELAQDHGWTVVDATGTPGAVIDRVAKVAHL